MYLLPKDDSFPCYEGVGRASRGVAPELDEVSKRLLRAAEIIRERGWCQRSRQNADGQVCTRGAILHALYGRAYNLPASVIDPNGQYQECATRLIRQIGRDGLCAEVAWNDAPGRTKEEVIAALESAALHRHAVAAYP